MRVSPENSLRIANLSFVCVCCVVLIHVPWPTAGLSVRNLLAAMTVPYFFVVAGYFLASCVGAPGWWRAAVVRRVRSLIVPYVLWMAITAVLMWVLSGVRPIGLGNSGLDLRKVPLLVPLWFIRALFLFVLTSPLILLALRCWGRGVLAVEFVAAGAVSTLLTCGGWTVDAGWGGLFSYGFPPEGLFYFTVGMWLQAHPVPCGRSRSRRIWLPVSFAVIALRVLSEVCRVPVFFNLDLLTVPFCLIALWLVTPSVAWPKVLVGNSFSIYVMHAVVLGVLWTVPLLKGHCPFGLAVAAGIGIPILISSVLRRWLPRTARILLGGR